MVGAERAEFTTKEVIEAVKTCYVNEPTAVRMIRGICTQANNDGNNTVKYTETQSKDGRKRTISYTGSGITIHAIIAGMRNNRASDERIVDVLYNLDYLQWEEKQSGENQVGINDESIIFNGRGRRSRKCVLFKRKSRHDVTLDSE